MFWAQSGDELVPPKRPASSYMSGELSEIKPLVISLAVSQWMWISHCIITDCIITDVFYLKISGIATSIIDKTIEFSTSKHAETIVLNGCHCVGVFFALSQWGHWRKPGQDWILYLKRWGAWIEPSNTRFFRPWIHGIWIDLALSKAGLPISKHHFRAKNYELLHDKLHDLLDLRTGEIIPTHYELLLRFRCSKLEATWTWHWILDGDIGWWIHSLMDKICTQFIGLAQCKEHWARTPQDWS